MSGNLTVVLVEKNPEDLEALGQVLRNELSLNDIRTASNAAEALEQIEAMETVDWLITEVDLPDENGFELIEIAKTLNSMRDAAVVVITEHADRASIMTAAALGAADFISKPFQMGALTIKLRKLLSMRYKRSSERVTVIGKQATITLNEGTRYTGDILDISEGGCQLGVTQLDQGGSIFEQLDIAIPTTDGEIHMAGEIVRQERHPFADKSEKKISIAIQFDVSDDDAIEKLRHFIQQNSH